MFGVPLVREDDALRAVRAAVELRERVTAASNLAGVTLEVRIGVNTGEVVAGDPTAGHGFVTGEPVVIGKRLQQAGGPGEILLGERTYRLVAHAVDGASLRAPNVKNEAAELPAYRLRTVDADATALPRRDDAPLVGREREQYLLAETWQRVVGERVSCLFTVVGAAGVGKSRLAAEFIASLDGVKAVRGRCLPYGEGITYRPVIEVIEQLPSVELGPLAAGAIRSLLGTEARSASADEISWAFRKLLAGAAAEQPIVIVAVSPRHPGALLDRGGLPSALDTMVGSVLYGNGDWRELQELYLGLGHHEDHQVAALAATSVGTWLGFTAGLTNVGSWRCYAVFDQLCM